MRSRQPRIVIVTRRTRMEGLLSAYGTRGQAAFGFKRSKVAALYSAGHLEDAMEAQAADEDEDFMLIEEEDQTYRQSIRRLRAQLNFDVPVQEIDRSLVVHLDFYNCAAVVVLGQDGLVANTAKYVTEVPIVGVNPDPAAYDGVLLPFTVGEAHDAVSRVLNQRATIREVTLAEATLHDGQTMLAFNDFFVGSRTHTSARYELTVSGRQEAQLSSGVLVSTGAGSTGWMSSVYNMARGVAEWLGQDTAPQSPTALAWEDPSLLWAVREPFRSQTSDTQLTAGRLEQGEQLRLESRMSGEGVIFSDGMESDTLPFNAGAIARIGVASRRAKLVAPRPQPR